MYHNDFTSFKAEALASLEKTLSSIFSQKKNLPYQALFDAALYAIEGPAKRLRPLLVLSVAEDLGGFFDKALIPAAAIEMVHTYSLVHDDLPCMDDDDIRRGKPSLHKAVPEGLAVLTGDFLLTEAFYQLSIAPGLSDTQKLKLIQILSEYAGGSGMIAGQVIDIQDQEKDLKELELAHKLKTANLMIASLLFGGVVAGASSEMLQKLEHLGEKIGLAYQAYDDILDAEEKTASSTYRHLGDAEARSRLIQILEATQADLNKIEKLPLLEAFTPSIFDDYLQKATNER